jgi:hypothetical protein
MVPTAIRCHDDLIEYIRARKEELGLSNAFIEDKCHMAEGHVDKILGPSQVNNLSKFTMDYFLTLFAIELVPRVDEVQAEKMRPMWEGREERNVRVPGRRLSKAILERARPLFYRQLSVLGNAARKAKLPPEARSRIARAAALRRWQRRRAALKASAMAESAGA